MDAVHDSAWREAQRRRKDEVVAERHDAHDYFHRTDLRAGNMQDPWMAWSSMSFAHAAPMAWMGLLQARIQADETQWEKRST